jgi:hypothetical protein
MTIGQSCGYSNLNFISGNTFYSLNRAQDMVTSVYINLGEFLN